MAVGCPRFTWHGEIASGRRASSSTKRYRRLKPCYLFWNASHRYGNHSNSYAGRSGFVSGRRFSYFANRHRKSRSQLSFCCRSGSAFPSGWNRRSNFLQSLYRCYQPCLRRTRPRPSILTPRAAPRIRLLDKSLIAPRSNIIRSRRSYRWPGSGFFRKQNSYLL